MSIDIGKRIKCLRTKTKLSNRQLAIRAGLSQPVMNRLENNERKADFLTLQKICSALDITLADFFAPASKDADVLPLELNQLLASARKLSPEQLKLAQQLLDEMGSKQSKEKLKKE